MTITHQLLHDDGAATRWGATRGQSDLGDLVSRIENAEQPVVVLDFTGIEVANGSYVRATALWLLRCALKARANSSDELTGSDPWRIRPLRMGGFFLAGLADEVRIDVSIQLNESRLPCAEVLEWNGEVIKRVAMHGHLDTQLRRALDCLLELGEESAAETLWKRFPQDGIGPTGWSNRLSELYQRQLIDRKKEGKFWKYSANFKEVIYGL